MSFAMLLEDVLAGWLSTQGLNPGDRVQILGSDFPNCLPVLAKGIKINLTSEVTAAVKVSLSTSASGSQLM